MQVSSPRYSRERAGRFADFATIESGDATRLLESDPLHTCVFDGAARAFYFTTEIGRLRFAGNEMVDDLLSDVPMSTA